MRKFLTLGFGIIIEMIGKLSKKEKSNIRKVFGVVVILVGLAGLALPFLPGWLLIFIGLELVGIELIFFEKIKAFVKKKTGKEKS